jgi:hypothetical protein
MKNWVRPWWIKPRWRRHRFWRLGSRVPSAIPPQCEGATAPLFSHDGDILLAMSGPQAVGLMSPCCVPLKYPHWMLIHVDICWLCLWLCHVYPCRVCWMTYCDSQWTGVGCPQWIAFSLIAMMKDQRILKDGTRRGSSYIIIIPRWWLTFGPPFAVSISKLAWDDWAQPTTSEIRWSPRIAAK